MKKLKYIVMLAALFALGACQRSQEERNGILKVYNWADYIDEDVLRSVSSSPVLGIVVNIQ